MEIIEKARKLWQDGKEKEAIEILLTEDIDNNGQANTMIGEMYSCAQRGQSNIKRDYKKARQYFEKGLQLGYAKAGLELGKFYYFGDGVKKNYKKAEEYWARSFSLGSELAGFELANFYYDDLPKKIEEAIKIYKELIAINEFVGNCYSKLSNIYEKGMGGISPNEALSLEYMEKGANEGHIHCCMNLGLKYYRGDGVPQNRKTAIEIVERVKNDDLFKREVNVLLDKMIKNEEI